VTVDLNENPSMRDGGDEGRKRGGFSVRLPRTLSGRQMWQFPLPLLFKNFGPFIDPIASCQELRDCAYVRRSPTNEKSSSDSLEN
jgi:hypothetical protein